jgi:hypothetical protein
LIVEAKLPALGRGAGGNIRLAAGLWSAT